MTEALFVGKTADGENVTGSIKIPEVAHDTEADEYVVCLLYCALLCEQKLRIDSSTWRITATQR